MNNRIKRYVIHACLMVVCAVITVSCATTSSSDSGRGKDRQSIYMAHLKKEGYSPSLDSEGDITFTSEGFTYFITIDSDDPAAFYLLLPSIKAINSDSDRRRAANAVSAVNREVKVVKAYIVNSQNRSVVTIGAEVFLENPDHFAVLFARLLRTTTRAREVFDENF